MEKARKKKESVTIILRKDEYYPIAPLDAETALSLVDSLRIPERKVIEYSVDYGGTLKGLKIGLLHHAIKIIAYGNG